MANEKTSPINAYANEHYLKSSDARTIRIHSEYIEPEARFEECDVDDTIASFGSARILAREEANHKLHAARDRGGDVEAAEHDLAMSSYYEDAR